MAGSPHDNPDREFDKTCLKVHGLAPIHRDYLAHVFRWGHISKLTGDKRVLEIGCGVDLPLERAVSHYQSTCPSHYLGVDINPEPKVHRNHAWADHCWEFDFSSRWKELAADEFDLIVCTEVVEHMRMPAVRKLLHGAHELLADGGLFVLSTPVANGRPARNHINEMSIETLQAELTRAGWQVEKRHGTFMNWNDCMKALDTLPAGVEHGIRWALQELMNYYSGEVVACMLAPLFPDFSRNNVWFCRRTDDLESIL